MLPSLRGHGGGIELHARTLVESVTRVRPSTHVGIVARFDGGIDESSRPRFSARVLLATLRQRPRVVVCEHLHHAPLALVAARLVGARVVVWAHGVEAWDVHTHSQRIALRAADRVVSVSQHTHASLRRQALVSDMRGVVIGNAIAIEPYTPTPRGGFVLSISRLVASERYKGIEETLHALASLPGAPEYLVAGEGDDRARLEAKAVALGVRARFLGKVDEATKRELYRTASLFVLPSAGEGFGYVFAEALAAGLPVIAGDAGGALETVGTLGTLVSPHDPSAIARAIADHFAGRTASPLRDHAHLAREAARRFGIERFDAEVGSLLHALEA